MSSPYPRRGHHVINNGVKDIYRDIINVLLIPSVRQSQNFNDVVRILQSQYLYQSFLGKELISR